MCNILRSGDWTSLNYDRFALDLSSPPDCGHLDYFSEPSYGLYGLERYIATPLLPRESSRRR